MGEKLRVSSKQRRKGKHGQGSQKQQSSWGHRWEVSENFQEGLWRMVAVHQRPLDLATKQQQPLLDRFQRIASMKMICRKQNVQQIENKAVNYDSKEEK